jgi:hypothetical protein
LNRKIAIQIAIYICCFVMLTFTGGCTDTIDDVVGSAEGVACEALEGSDRDHCYQDAAVRKSDPSLCEEIEYGPPRSKCYMRIAEKDGDVSFCGDLMINPGYSGEYSRLECYQRVAVATQDPAYCTLMGLDSVSMMSGVYNKESCYGALGLEVPSIQEIYDENPDNFLFCYDIVYTEIYDEAPPARSGKPDIGSEKSEIATLMNTAGYEESSRGYVSEENPELSFMDLQEGDVILLGFDSSPDPSNSPHYAVVKDGKIWQIVHWDEGGQLDGPRDPEFFFKPRILTNPYSGKTYPEFKPYHYYAVYRK